MAAAVLLVADRLLQGRRPSRATPAGSGADAAPATTAPEAAPPAADAATAAGQVVDLDAPAIDPDDPDAVWVVDGRPRYHTRDCATLASLDAEPIPRGQALEDGFVACSLCEPGTRPTPDARAGSSA